MTINIETLNQLHQALERATKATEALKIAIAADDNDGISAESTELVQALLVIDGVYVEIIK